MIGLSPPGKKYFQFITLPSGQKNCAWCWSSVCIGQRSKGEKCSRVDRKAETGAVQVRRGGWRCSSPLQCFRSVQTRTGPQGKKAGCLALAPTGTDALSDASECWSRRWRNWLVVAFSFSVPAERRGVEHLRGVDRWGSDVLTGFFIRGYQWWLSVNQYQVKEGWINQNKPKPSPQAQGFLQSILQLQVLFPGPLCCPGLCWPHSHHLLLPSPLVLRPQIQLLLTESQPVHTVTYKYMNISCWCLQVPQPDFFCLNSLISVLALPLPPQCCPSVKVRGASKHLAMWIHMWKPSCCWLQDIWPVRYPDECTRTVFCLGMGRKNACGQAPALLALLMCVYCCQGFGRRPGLMALLPCSLG